MMLRLTDIQDWIISLGIAEESHVYIGKLDNKQQKSIGIYNRSGSWTTQYCFRWPGIHYL